MKSIPEIKDSAKSLYNSNASFIFSTMFIAILLIGVRSGLSQNIWLAILLFLTWPLEHCIVLIVLRTVKGKARGITVKDYLFEGFKDYRRWMGIYGGRMLLAYGFQIAVIAVFILLALLIGNDIGVYLDMITDLFTGSSSLISNTSGGLGFTEGQTFLSALASITSTVVGFVVLMMTFILPYFAVDQNLDFTSAFSKARETMKGKYVRLFLLNISYLGWIILSMLGTGMVMMSIGSLYGSFVNLNIELSVPVYMFIYNFLTSVVSAAFSGYIYQGKSYLAIGVFYMDITGQSKKSTFLDKKSKI